MTLLLLLATACGDEQGAGDPGMPTLLLGDSVGLQEGDSAFVGQPYHLEIAADGSFLVSDLFSKRVLVFRRDGSFAGSIGRRGSGTGEFDRPSQLALGGDSLLYVLTEKPTANHGGHGGRHGGSRRNDVHGFSYPPRHPSLGGDLLPQLRACLRVPPWLAPAQPRGRVCLVNTFVRVFAFVRVFVVNPDQSRIIPSENCRPPRM